MRGGAQGGLLRKRDIRKHCTLPSFPLASLFRQPAGKGCYKPPGARRWTATQKCASVCAADAARPGPGAHRRPRTREHIAGRARLGGRGRRPGRHTRPERAPSGSAGGKGPPVTRPALSRRILMTRTHFPADPTHREPAGHSVTDGRSADSLTRLAPTVGGQRLQPPASSQFSVKQENELPAL